MIFTFDDAVNHLKDTDQFGDQTRSHSAAIKAVARAVRDLPNYARWSYYNRETTLLTSAPYSTGTIAYTHSSRQVALTGGTWPDDASLYRIIIGTVHYQVESRVSDTILTLPVENNPGADVAAGTAFILYRNSYPVPLGFRRAASLIDVEDERVIRVVDSMSQHRMSVQAFDTPGTPEYVTIRGTDDWLGGLNFVFVPAPDAARQYALMYQATARDPRIERISGDDASVTGGTSTITFGSGTVPAHAAGSVIRLSATATTPTPPWGESSDTQSVTFNSYDLERTIDEVVNATTVVVDEVIPSNYVTVGYVISDPIDIEQGAMLTVFLRLIEAEFAKLIAKGTPQERASYWNTFERALRDAKSADRRETMYQRGGSMVSNPYQRTRTSTAT